MRISSLGPASTAGLKTIKTDKYGLTDSDFELLNELAFFAAMLGRDAEAKTIAAAVELMAPGHAAPMITRALYAAAVGNRKGAIELLREVGTAKKRRWEEAEILLLQYLDPEEDVDEIARIRARLLESERSEELLSIDDEDDTVMSPISNRSV